MRGLAHVLLALLIIGFVVQVSFAQTPRDAASARAGTAFQEQHPGAVMHWDEATGVPSLLYRIDIAPPAPFTTSEAAARAFFAEHHALLGMKRDASDLRLLRHHVRGGRHHLDFQQTVQGIPVSGAVYSVTVDARRHVRVAGGRYYPSVRAPDEPKLSAEDALNEARAGLGITSEQSPLQPVELVIVPGRGRFVLAYHVVLYQGEVLVDATTGAIEKQTRTGVGLIEERRRMAAASSKPSFPALESATIEGTGYAYPEDPDAGGYESVPLPRLHGAGDRLDGEYVRVTNIFLNDGGEITRSRDGGVDYRYEPHSVPDSVCGDFLPADHDCSHFDDVNVYYHIDRFAHTFWEEYLGHDIPFQVLAVTHVQGVGVAHWRDVLLRFGYGDITFKDVAKQDDVIYHEYTHIVTGQLGLEVGIGVSEETAALSEGYADYFAATFTDDPIIGEWVVTCPPRAECQGPPDDTELRRLDSDPNVWNWNRGNPSTKLRYGVCTRFHPEDLKCKTTYNNFTPRYTWGIIWGSALWDLREALGRDVTDRLIFESLFYLHGSEVTFRDAFRSLLVADEEHFSGQYRSVIEDVFARRGIVAPGQSVTASETSDVPAPLSLKPNYPNPFHPQTAIPFTIPRAGPVTLAVYDVLGRRVETLVSEHRSAGNHVATWEARQQPGGVYVIRLEHGNAVQTRKITLVK